MSTAPHLALGRAAESAAARFLERHGYQVLTTNFRARGGELDIVAMDVNTISPPHDVGGMSALLAANIMLEGLLLFVQRPERQ